ncbi:MAG TPA: ABC transporter permease [Vicinamibacterales bacterium]|nr:ABC transporter permease [Vicinamibacterales bacterium]
MLQDYKLGVRMLLKYPGLTIAGGLALAIAIGIGAGWYDLWGKLLWPTIPLPDGDRIVSIETHNALTNQPELRVARDFLEWRSDVRSIDGLGAYRAELRNLIVGNAPPVLIGTAALTATAFRTARVTPLIGRGLLDADETPGAPGVVVLGYDVWQRSFEGRNDVVGSTVRLGSTPVTVVGVMPKGLGYPLSYQAWTPLQLRALYGALEGDPLGIIGRLKPGITLEQANAELRVLGERAAAALPATHAHLRPLVVRLGQRSEIPDIAGLALMYLPSLLVLLLACTTVGTLFYARTAIREGEMAVRSALGASRVRIISQLFVEALVLASIAAAVGLIAADRTLRWGIESVAESNGGVPFWMAPGLEITTMLYAGGLAVAGAAMVSLLPALRVTRTRLQSHLTNLGAGGSTLRFGRVWTTAMIAQVALTAIAIPIGIEGASQAILRVRIHGQFPSHEYFNARLEFDRPAGEEMTSVFEERRARAYARLEQQIAEEPDVVAVTFADRAPGGSLPINRTASVEIPSGAGPAFQTGFAVSSVGPGFFEAFNRPIIAGRGFHGGDFSSAARTVIVNEAFVRGFVQRGIASPLGARLRYSSESGVSAAEPSAAAGASADKPFEIVGVVRDLGLDPGEQGDEAAYVFHAASAATVSPLVMSVRLRGNPATLAARLPVIAAGVDGGLSVLEARSLGESIWQRDFWMVVPVAALAGVSALVLLLSAMGLFALMSISVSRRTREIGLRMALGANPRHVLARIVAHGMVLMGSGVLAGGGVVLFFVAVGGGPTGRPADDVVLFAAWIGITSAVMLGAGLLACVEPARRALRINPIDALRDA